MIEMSVDKEMVLPGSGREDPALHIQTQQHMLEHAGSSDRKAEAAGALVAMSVSSEGSTGGDLLGSGSLAPQQTLHLTLNTGCSRTESVGLEARIGGHNFLPRNGVHQPLQQQKQPSQQQKLNKRRYSMNVGFKHPGFSKRRRRANSESDPVLPTNFLMGGNIFDPLNLNSLLDEEVNQALNAETPKSSPLPAKNRDPVEILIPKDITDPLNLSGGGGILVSPMKSGGRKRHRNRHHGGGGGGGGVIPPAQPDGSESEAGKASEGCTAETGGAFVPLLPVSSDGAGVVPEGPFPLNLIPVPESPRPYELNTSINCRDEVVPPLLPNSHLHSGPSAVLKSQVHGPGDSSSRHRKRRRTFSKSESLPATPAALAKRGSVERGPALRAGKHSQTFHTPVGGGVTGHLPAVSRCGQQRPQNRRRERKFQYGNYNKYYGYRNPGLSEDPRVCVLRSEWFRGKAVLDLGCNTGHLTLTIAKNWHPSRIVGLDIDGRLVHAAQQNVRHYLSELHVQEAWQARREMQKKDGTEQSEGEKESGGQEKEKPEVDTNDEHLPPGPSEDKGAGMESNIKVGEGTVSPKKLGSRFFPISFRVCRGPIAAPPLFALPPGDFPANVSFIKGNYVLESDALLQTQQPEYDVILCLSVTKWVHLNWGDGGLQRLFKRAFRNLHPGGVFILEPQPWSSYGRRKKLTDTIYKNYYKIRLKPDQFTSYLTSEVGFTSYELIGTPKTTSRGFQRPIYLFHKGPSSRK